MPTTTDDAATVRHLTTRELAVREGVSIETVYVWNRDHTGPRYMRVGKHVRYRLADVEEWEQSRLVRQTP